MDKIKNHKLSISEKCDSTLNVTETLNADNTFLNAINLDDSNFTLKTPKSKPHILKQKNVLQKTSSGFSSMSSFEDFANENYKSVHEKENNSSLKRPSGDTLPIIPGKKLKFCGPSMSQNVCDTKINESGIGVLQDTFDSLDVTRLLEQSENEAKCPSNASECQFDTFESLLHKTDSNQSHANRKLFDSECGESIPSQFFNTQVVNQLEKECNLNNHNVNLRKKDETKSKGAVQNLKRLEVPVLQEKLNTTVCNETMPCEELKDRSALFVDEKVTTQYREEVDNLFEQIEHSIFAMGTTDHSSKVPDKLLDIFLNHDVKETTTREESEQNSENINWSDNTLLNGISFNTSFGSVIKKALINNATKPVHPQKPGNNTLNLTLSEKKVEFCSMGPFYGLPLKVKDLIKQYKGIEELYDWQHECLSLPAIDNKKNLIYALPTSGGKTLVAEILMLREIMCYKRNAIFILPYVSIVQEKVWAFSPFGVALDFLVEEYASNKGVYPPRKRRRKNCVYIATIEKALGIINSLIETNRLHEIGLIVVDELHLIGEAGRGATLEACLTKIMFLKANIQIVGMSATIGNLSEISGFLSADVYTKNFRPIELIEYVKCGKEIAKVNWNHTSEDDLLVEPKKVKYRYSDSLSKIDPDMLGGLVTDVVPNGSCLIFCPSKKNCENVANLLCRLCKPNLKNHKKTEKEQLIHALKDEAGDLCEILKVSVQYGIAYHHSGLTSDERRIIEEGFRTGIIYVICCTSTLAAGVNLPAKRVILRSPYIGKEFINLSRYKQMVGRAGRTGLGEAGDSILIAQQEDMSKIRDLLLSPMNQALSGMHILEGKGLRHLLLSCISLGMANTRPELQAVTSKTLLAAQSDKLDVCLKNLTDKIIKNLFKLGALQESCAIKKTDSSSALTDVSLRMDVSSAKVESQDTPLAEKQGENSNTKKKRVLVLTNSTKLVVSELGCAAIKGGLELSRAHLLYEDLFQAQSSLVLQGHLHLLYLVTPYETADQIKPNMQIYYEVLTHLKPNEMKVAKILGINESVAVKMLSNNPIKNVPERVLNRFYVTLMLYDLWNEMPVFQVSEKYQINRGIVQNLMTISATFASNVVNFCEQLEEFWAYSYLLKGMSQRLSHCCIKELLPLMELPAVKQSRAKQLYNAGYKTLQSIAKANADDLVNNIEFMSRRVANQLIAASKMLLLERVENLREEAEDVLDGVENPKQFFNQTLNVR